jgi:hypothetical protein
MNNTDTTTDSTAASTDATSASHSLSLWTQMWNTDSDIALRICSDDFRIHFGNSEPDGSNPGDAVRGAKDFARFLVWNRAEHPGIVFAPVHEAIDGLHGRLVWDMAAGNIRAGGIDVFDFTEDGLIREVWSAGGTRSMAG